ncbi:beta-glucoside-specific PTS transporter subunit IIABC [Robertmurraya sp. P23]|uniref:beta-glucoside-specific PTS transporter subunit IIABC n=1 Tax=Robertmurraya sp. P23 TaxID=3436931 RepID=UPI003D985999
MKHNDLAIKIIDLIGGDNNISQLTHCATRLRFVLRDDSKADILALDRLEGVLKAQNKGGQMQVIIGAKVDAVYEQICKLANISAADHTDVKRKGNSFNRALETIAGIFTPILPALVGCGMVKSLSIILTTFAGVDPQSGFISIINMIGDIVFFFLPFFLAVSAARKFGTNEYISIALAGALLHPTILDAAKAVAETGVTSIDFLGLPILLVRYSSSVIPIILSVWILSYVYRMVDKAIPEFLRVILTPMIVLFIMVPLELIAIAPFGSYVGNWLTQGINLLFASIGVIAGGLLGFFKPILVMLGMHYSLMPMQIQQIAELGYTVLLPSALGANLAQAGAALGVFFLTKNKTMKSAAGSSAIPAFFGITEPAIYGVNLIYKRPFFAGCAAAGIVGGFYSLVNASGTAIALPGILSLSTYQADKYIYIIIGSIMAVGLGFIFTLVAGIKENETNNAKEEKKSNKRSVQREFSIMSPFKGEVRDLVEVDDSTFSQELMGKGIAIIPSDGKVYAPFDGTVDVLFKTRHAIGLKSETGIEVLIHIGLETVNLEGKYFTSHVQQAQKVKSGELLIEFDMEAIQKEGYDIITPVIVTNSDSYLDILPVSKGLINENYELLKVVS